MEENIKNHETNSQKNKAIKVEENHSKNVVPDRFLPIGSIVTLKDAKKSIMIIGYCPINENKELFDYCGVLVPEGLLKTDEFLVFNHETISQLNFLGYQDEEQKKWVDYVESILKYNNLDKSFENQSGSNNNDNEKEPSELLFNSVNNTENKADKE